MIVYSYGAPVLTKDIPIGGVLLTEEIQRTMGVSYEEAEDLKINGDDNVGCDSEKLAKIIASSVLAGELSLISALASNELISAHLKLNR